MWKTADRPVITRVIRDLPSERREGKSGKHFPFFDIFALSIYAPHRCLIGHPSRRTKPACLHENSATVPRRHTLNLPLLVFGGNDFFEPGSAVSPTLHSGAIPEKVARCSSALVLVVKRYEGHVRSMFKRMFG